MPCFLPPLHHWFVTERREVLYWLRHHDQTCWPYVMSGVLWVGCAVIVDAQLQCNVPCYHLSFLIPSASPSPHNGPSSRPPCPPLLLLLMWCYTGHFIPALHAHDKPSLLLTPRYLRVLTSTVSLQRQLLHGSSFFSVDLVLLVNV